MLPFKWGKKICIEHIVHLKDPLENMSKGNGQGGLSPIAQTLKKYKENEFERPILSVGISPNGEWLAPLLVMRLPILSLGENLSYLLQKHL